jgi:hypothetical protein
MRLISDTSNANFAITVGGLAVTSPNGWESWVRGTTHAITWTSTGSSGAYVKIELIKVGVVNTVISTNTANGGSYSWTMPTAQTIGTDYKIRVTNMTNTAITDSSNTNFSIVIGSQTVTSICARATWETLNKLQFILAHGSQAHSDPGFT